MEWVAIKDKIPTSLELANNHVLLLTQDNEYIFTIGYNKNGSFFCPDAFCDFRVNEITHWLIVDFKK